MSDSEPDGDGKTSTSILFCFAGSSALQDSNEEDDFLESFKEFVRDLLRQAF